MLYVYDQREVEVSPPLERIEVTSASNTKVFKIFFGQIYPDIIKAVVRELFTNAWDSQKDAGTLDTPIDIHAPSHLEPWFSIRDYGTGMSYDLIKEVYAVLFESSKDTDDFLAGKFGMGSKTPLGYTDSFALTSYVNGEYMSFNIYLGSGNSPYIDLVARGKTEEPNGVMVQLGVAREDIDAFNRHIEAFVLNAGTTTNINGKPWLTHPTITKSGDNWTYDANLTGNYIRMGCVLYRLSSHLASGDAKSYIMNSNGFIINCEIGEFDITPSREDIVYDAKSNDLILQKFNNIKREIYSQLDVEAAGARNKGEYLRIVNNVFDIKLWDISRDLTIAPYKGKTYNQLITELRGLIRYSSLRFQYLRETTNGAIVSREVDGSYNEYKFLRSDYQSYIIKHSGKRPTLPGRRNRTIWEQEGTSCIIDVGYIAPTIDQPITLLQEFMDPDKEVVDYEDIPPAPIKRRERGRRAAIDRSKVHDIVINDYNQYKVSSTRSITPTEGMLYVKINRSTISISSELSLDTMMMVANGFNKKVVCIRKTDEGLIGDLKLESLEDFFKRVTSTIDFTPEQYINEAYDKIYLEVSRYVQLLDKTELLGMIKDWVQPSTEYNGGFKMDINPVVRAKFELVYNYILSLIEQINRDNPLLKHINPMRTRLESIIPDLNMENIKYDTLHLK